MICCGQLVLEHKNFHNNQRDHVMERGLKYSEGGIWIKASIPLQVGTPTKIQDSVRTAKEAENRLDAARKKQNKQTNNRIGPSSWLRLCIYTCSIIGVDLFRISWPGICTLSFAYLGLQEQIFIYFISWDLEKDFT